MPHRRAMWKIATERMTRLLQQYEDRHGPGWVADVVRRRLGIETERNRGDGEQSLSEKED